MTDLTVEDRIEASRHLRGKIAACAAEMARLNGELSHHNDAIHADMRSTLQAAYGKDYSPRITFYSSDRAAAVPYVVAGFLTKDASE